MPRILRIVAVPALILSSPLAMAASPPEQDARDQVLVVARDVMPRIAYRGLEPDQNPVRVQAVTFPGRIFHGAVDAMVADLVGESELQRTTTGGGLGMPAPMTQLTPSVHPEGAAGMGSMTAAQAPLGAGASPAGAIGRATAGIADAVLAATARIGGGP